MAHDSSDVRVALIGYGLGGAAFHAPLIASTPGMRLTTIVTSNAERRSQAAREHPQANIVDSVQAVWDRAQDHDVVVVTTSNDSHVSLAMAALAAGLPVVVDKPFAVHAAEARQVIEEAQRRNLMLTVYHNRRWDSEVLTVKRLLAEQALGDVLRFESRLERWRPEPKGGWREQGAPELAGGLLYDLGTHLIDQALDLFGPVTHVYAELDRRRPGMQVDDDTFIALTHTSGVRSHLTASSAQCAAARTHARARFARGLLEGTRRYTGSGAACRRAPWTGLGRGAAGALGIARRRRRGRTRAQRARRVSTVLCRRGRCVEGRCAAASRSAGRRRGTGDY